MEWVRRGAKWKFHSNAVSIQAEYSSLLLFIFRKHSILCKIMPWKIEFGFEHVTLAPCISQHSWENKLTITIKITRNVNISARWKVSDKTRFHQPTAESSSAE